jgi:hypothetical protein
MAVDVEHNVACRHVEHLSSCFIGDMTSYRYDGWYVTNCLSQNFVCFTADYNVTTSRDDFIKATQKAHDPKRKAAQDLNQRLHLRVVSSTSEMDRELRSATVWLTLHVEGLSMAGCKGLQRESVVRMRWKKGRGGRWLCVRANVIRGPGSTFGVILGRVKDCEDDVDEDSSSISSASSTSFCERTPLPP